MAPAYKGTEMPEGPLPAARDPDYRCEAHEECRVFMSGKKAEAAIEAYQRERKGGGGDGGDEKHKAKERAEGEREARLAYARAKERAGAPVKRKRPAEPSDLSRISMRSAKRNRNGKLRMLVDEDDERDPDLMRRSVVWLQLSTEGYCTVTLEGQSDSCETGNKGTWALEKRHNKPWTWRAATEVCILRCSACRRCNYITVSPMNLKCSWFHACDLPALELATGKRRDPAYRSGKLPSGHYTQVPEPQCRSMTVEGAKLQVPPAPMTPLPSAKAMTAKSAAYIASASPPPSAALLPWRLLTISDIRCSERYVQMLRCANRVFLFSRRDLGDHKRMETLVRVAGPVRLPALAPTTTPVRDAWSMPRPRIASREAGGPNPALCRSPPR